MSNSPETLDKLIRDKVTRELEGEIKKDFDALIRKYFGNSSDRNRLFIPAYSRAVSTATKPGDSTVPGSTVDVVELFAFLRSKALANESTRRGDTAVAAFLDRVESIGNEIEDLRSRVPE